MRNRVIYIYITIPPDPTHGYSKPNIHRKLLSKDSRVMPISHRVDAYVNIGQIY